MKQSSVVTTVILVAAVLVAAYAIGRLIRQARLDTPPQQVAADPNDANEPDAVAMSRRINRRRKELTPDEKAKAKQERADQLAADSDLTDAEKEERREEMRQQLRAKRGGPGQVPEMSPEELREMTKRWNEMSEAEREEAKAAIRAKMRSGGARRPRPSGTTPNDPQASQGSAAEPNAADPN